MKKYPKGLLCILAYFGDDISIAQNRYHEFVNALIDQKYDSPLKKTMASSILGHDDFIEEIKRKYISTKMGDRDLLALGQLAQWPSIEEITKEVIPIPRNNATI